MDDKDKNELGPSWSHLSLRDSRTPEERSAAESKEWARRHGRGRRDWWKDEKKEPPA